MNDAGAMFNPLPRGRPNGFGSRRDAEEWVPISPVPEDAPRELPPHSLGRPNHVWDYRNSAGRLLGRVCRWDHVCGKMILPLMYCEGSEGRRAWRWVAPREPRPLFGLDRLAQRLAAPVLVTEGEKTADAAAALFPDHVIVTSPGGSSAAGKADWSALAGRHVVIWPDNDGPGRAYAADVARLAADAGAASVRVVEVPVSWPPRWDLADPLPDGVSEDLLREMLTDAPPAITAGAANTDDDGEVARLALLPAMAYDREREAAAKRLGVRVSTLDAAVTQARADEEPADASTGKDAPDLLREIDPWSSPVDGAALCTAITRALAKFVILPPGAATAVALWCLHAHAHAAAQHGPVLAVQSAEKRCGKTTLLSIVLRMVPKPLPAANISPAALFRSVEKYQPTLLIDEADSFLRGNEDMRGVLNAGFTRATAFVIRCDGDDNDPRPFGTWCPKLIASIGRLPETVQDRSIVITLRRRLDTEIVQRFAPADHAELDSLARQAARWAADNVIALTETDPVMPSGLHDRLKDCWRPLLAIADHVGDRWPEAARRAAVELSSGAGDAEAQSAGTILLMHIRELLADRPSIGSTALVSNLTSRDDWPWCEWRQGHPITARGVARLLAGYGIRPTRTRDGSQYTVAMFADAWRRYTPEATDLASATSATATKTLLENNALLAPMVAFASATTEFAVADEEREIPRNFNGVADEALAARKAAEDIIEGAL